MGFQLHWEVEDFKAIDMREVMYDAEMKLENAGLLEAQARGSIPLCLSILLIVSKQNLTSSS